MNAKYSLTFEKDDIDLFCPTHRLKLATVSKDLFVTAAALPDGQLQCRHGCSFAIRGGIPRFVANDSYAASFGTQWTKWRTTQLDSYTRQNYSRQRLERCLGLSLEDLHDKVVLECGSGAGRFTEHLVKHSRFVASIDLSEAVDSNLENCSDLKHYLLCQADINDSPLPYQFFDVVVCLGVLQHTPSPEQSITNLAKHLKPGGLLIIDHYATTSILHTVSKCLTLACPIRLVLRRLPPELCFRVTCGLTALCDPIRKYTCRKPWLDRLASRIFPSACYYNKFPMLNDEAIYRWNELDTFDELTDFYKHFRTKNQLCKHLQSLGLENISCVMSGDIVEARAFLPMARNFS